MDNQLASSFKTCIRHRIRIVEDIPEILLCCIRTGYQVDNRTGIKQQSGLCHSVSVSVCRKLFYQFWISNGYSSAMSSGKCHSPCPWRFLWIDSIVPCHPFSFLFVRHIAAFSLVIAGAKLRISDELAKEMLIFYRKCFLKRFLFPCRDAEDAESPQRKMKTPFTPLLRRQKKLCVSVWRVLQSGLCYLNIRNRVSYNNECRWNRDENREIIYIPTLIHVSRSFSIVYLVYVTYTKTRLPTLSFLQKNSCFSFRIWRVYNS